MRNYAKSFSVALMLLTSCASSVTPLTIPRPTSPRMPDNVLYQCQDREGREAVCLSEEGATWVKNLLIHIKTLEEVPCFE